MVCIGIDLGGSWIKAALLKLDTLEIQDIIRVPAPGFMHGAKEQRVRRVCEIDPHELETLVSNLIDQLVRKAAVPCKGLFLTSQMGCTVVCDSLTSAPLIPIISWQDTRTLELLNTNNLQSSPFVEFKESLPSQFNVETGNELRPGVPAVLIWWLKRYRPEIFQNSKQWMVTSLGSWLLGRLGGCTPVIDFTEASALGLLDVCQLKWHDPMLEYCGLKKSNLPKLVSPGILVGELRLNNTLQSSLRLYSVCGDQQCALLGSQLGTHELSLNIATGSQVSRLFSQYQPSVGQQKIRPYFNQQWLQTITHIPAARATNAIKNLFLEGFLLAGMQPPSHKEWWEMVETACEKVPHTDLVSDLSFFPSYTGDSGMLGNLHEQNLTIGHIFRSLFQTMAQNYHKAALELWPQQDWENIVLSGGLIDQSQPLREEIQSQFRDKPQRYVKQTEQTLNGLLMLAKSVFC